MTIERKYNLQILTFVLVVLGVSLFFTEYFCGENDRCYEIFEPLFFDVVGIVPTLLILLCRENIFLSWFRHIGWWYLLGVTSFILLVSFENESFLTPPKEHFVLLSMGILFIVTLVYVVVRKKKSLAG